jgi:hypothetical protein
MIIRCLLLMLAGLVFVPFASAQLINTRTDKLNESLLESIINDDVSSDEQETILKELEYIRDHPFDLNQVKREDLEKLPFLTGFQIGSFLEYRATKGNLISIYELKTIHGFTEQVIETLLPFVTISASLPDEPLSLKQIAGKADHSAVLRVQRVLEKSAGYSKYDSVTGDMHYPGNPWLINGHYELKMTDHFRAGITVEKDPGEDIFKSSNRHGFDFNSGFLMIENAGKLKSLIVGDYRLAFGQGLTLWSGASAGKSSITLNTAKRQDTPKAFTSNDENNYFRGIAGSTTLNNVTLSVFFSVKNRDANISDTIDDRIFFTAFQESGYHRTKAEISDEKSVRETVFGGNLNYRNNFMKIGTTLVSYTFDKHLVAGDDPEDKYDFSGNHVLNAGIDYALTWKKMQAFGELSHGNASFATLHGVLMHVNKYASFSLLYRNFGPGYYAPNSSAFSERADDSNEEGFYAGIVIHPLAKVTLSAYADFYRFPWLKYNTSAPSSGTDYFAQADYAPGKISMFLRFKFGTDPEDETDELSALPVLTEVRSTGIRYHLAYSLGSSVVMQNRIEMVRSNPELSAPLNGFMFYHDISWRLPKLPLEFDLRTAYFNTDGYAARIYAYEQDLTAGYSFSPLYDEGLRMVLMAVYSIKKYYTIGIRYSRSQYFNKDELGSGTDAIHSASKNDLKLRISIRL